MKIKDLKGIIFNRVCIYTTKLGQFNELYVGKMHNVPDELLEYDVNVMVVSVKEKNVIDIGIKMD